MGVVILHPYVSHVTLYTVPKAPVPSTLPNSSDVIGVMMSRVALGGTLGGWRVWGREIHELFSFPCAALPLTCEGSLGRRKNTNNRQKEQVCEMHIQS